MNTMEPPRGEKVETLKDIIQDISAINNETNAQLNLIANALVKGGYPVCNDKKIDDPITMIDSIRLERDKAQESLKIIISIRECLW